MGKYILRTSISFLFFLIALLALQDSELLCGVFSRSLQMHLFFTVFSANLYHSYVKTYCIGNAGFCLFAAGMRGWHRWLWWQKQICRPTLHYIPLTGKRTTALTSAWVFSHSFSLLYEDWIKKHQILSLFTTLQLSGLLKFRLSLSCVVCFACVKF